MSGKAGSLPRAWRCRETQARVLSPSSRPAARHRSLSSTGNAIVRTSGRFARVRLFLSHRWRHEQTAGSVMMAIAPLYSTESRSCQAMAKVSMAKHLSRESH